MNSSRDNVVPIIRGATARLDKLERSELITVYQQYRTASNEWLRRQIVENNRIDILASVILGYEVQPFHLAILRWQFLHPESLQLVFRGSGKSTMGTVTKVIHYLCKNRDFTVAICSESKTNSAGFLREIKGHLENNQRLIEVFGPFYDPHVVGKWDSTEIDVVGKKHFGKESSVTCTGVDAAITSKHFDAGIFDDFAVEDNSRTEAVREKVKTWFYKTWTPLLKPPDPTVSHRGEHHGLGTRQHPEDIYQHLEKNELAGHTQVIRALDQHRKSPWPSRYSPEFFEDKERKMGIVLFGAQYQQDADAMKGEIFKFDNCVTVSDSEWPDCDELSVYMGLDLAVKDRQINDMFAISVIGLRGNVAKDDYWVYLLDFYVEHLSAIEQPSKILEFYDKWKPLRIGIETNQYQDIIRQYLKQKRPMSVCYPIETSIDKRTRATKLSPIFENRRVIFKKDVHNRAIDYLVRFPNGKGTKDFFDSFDASYRAATKKSGKRKRRTISVGVL